MGEGVEFGISQGFYGKGTTYVFPAAGGYNSNYTEIENYYAVVTACAVGEDGRAWVLGSAEYSGGYGANLWVCAPSVTYTSSGNNLYQLSNGASSATATVSGVAALVRGVNPEMTWRDVKLLLAESARRNHPENDEWVEGAARHSNPDERYYFNPNYGFGVVDAGKAVAMAKEWVNLSEMVTSTFKGADFLFQDPPVRPPARWEPPTKKTAVFVYEFNDFPEFIEHVEVRLDMWHRSMQDLEIQLTSPSGTVAKLMWPMPDADRTSLSRVMSLGASQFIGENPVGTWELKLVDHIPTLGGGVRGWELVLRGHNPVAVPEDAATVESRPNTSATGLPTIDGTLQVGETLTADTSGIADEDGLTNTVFSYQWVRSDGDSDTDITRATGSSYTLTEDDEGKTIEVTVSFTDDEDNPETLTSDATAAVAAAANNQATGTPTISGTAQVGQTLTADTTGIADEDGLTNVVFSYQWVRSDGGVDTNIQDATGSSYTLTEDDEGKAITVTVSFTDAEGNPETLTSDPTREVAAKPNTQATGQPTISGTVRVGETLTADVTGIADENGLDNVVFSYQWMADDANIQGATGSSYTLAEEKEGKTIKVSVSFTDAAGHPETLTSDPTGEVAMAKPGKPQDLEGEATAQEIKPTWEAPIGNAVVEYVVYRGTLQNGSMNGQALSKYATVEAAGKDMAYTDDNVEDGVEYRYRVAAVNSSGEGKKSTWLDIEAG